MEAPLTDADVSNCVGDFLDQALDLAVRFLSDRADLSASAAFVMNRLSREGPLRLTTLAAREGISQPSMTQLIQRLERHDLVTKVADPDDGRATLIGVTAQGQEFLDHRKELRRERLTELLTTLSTEEANALWLAARVAYPVLSRLVENADPLSDDSAAEQADSRCRE